MSYPTTLQLEADDNTTVTMTTLSTVSICDPASYYQVHMTMVFYVELSLCLARQPELITRLLVIQHTRTHSCTLCPGLPR